MWDVFWGANEAMELTPIIAVIGYHSTLTYLLSSASPRKLSRVASAPHCANIALFIVTEDDWDFRILADSLLETIGRGIGYKQYSVIDEDENLN